MNVDHYLTGVRIDLFQPDVSPPAQDFNRRTLVPSDGS
jgi:hypothetical protein